MDIYNAGSNLRDTLRQRRQRLAQIFTSPAILWSGCRSPRNFTANTYPFRASSHFLYFAGLPLENAAIYIESSQLTLFLEQPPPSAALWHGEISSVQEIAELIGAERVLPMAQLQSHVTNAATIPVQDAVTLNQQSQLLNRCISLETGIDLELAQAIIQLRLIHDAAAEAELRAAAAVTVKAHTAGMVNILAATCEAQVRAAIEAVIIAHNMSCAYSSIVTVCGEVLHNEQYHHSLQAGDLLLADVGAETASGWASDVTRTYPVNGKFSPTQRDIYALVLAAHDACIDKIHPGVEYLDIHLLAATVIAQGLVDLGILHGNADTLVEIGAHALFFPHGIGHLLGLDVHDMEDLGDLAGYEQGRIRSTRFGLNYLRLNRRLRPGMLVTIEPGFYQVPAILHNPEMRSKYHNVVNWDTLAKFNDVRGIRIEDDVLVTQTSSEVLTAALPNKADDIELVQSAC